MYVCLDLFLSDKAGVSVIAPPHKNEESGLSRTRNKPCMPCFLFPNAALCRVARTSWARKCVRTYEKCRSSLRPSANTETGHEYYTRVLCLQVHCVGQIIGAVLADSPILAEKAAKLVVVRYEDLPALVTIEEAIAANR